LNSGLCTHPESRCIGFRNEISVQRKCRKERSVREGVGAGRRNDPSLYAHMNNKTKKKKKERKERKR
jgi:hypothetical protein